MGRTTTLFVSAGVAITPATRACACGPRTRFCARRCFRRDESTRARRSWVREPAGATRCAVPSPHPPKGGWKSVVESAREDGANRRAFGTGALFSRNPTKLQSQKRVKKHRHSCQTENAYRCARTKKTCGAWRDASRRAQIDAFSFLVFRRSSIVKRFNFESTVRSARAPLSRRDPRETTRLFGRAFQSARDPPSSPRSSTHFTWAGVSPAASRRCGRGLCWIRRRCRRRAPTSRRASVCAR